MSSEYFSLNNGRSIPKIGLGQCGSYHARIHLTVHAGTWQSPPGVTNAAVLHALRAGYRHIDCAYAYSNESEVGQAITQAITEGVIRREDLFVTTKLWCTYHTRVREALDNSLAALQLEYVDMYLMHWPVAMNPNGNHELFPKLANGKRDIDFSRHHVDTYLEMEQLLADNTSKVKGIGVANYSKKYLEELLPRISVKPAINQIENHPFLPQTEIVQLCQAEGIHVTAYSPLGSAGSPLLADSRVTDIAKKRGVSPAAILLSYHGKRFSPL